LNLWQDNAKSAGARPRRAFLGVTPTLPPIEDNTSIFRSKLLMAKESKSALPASKADQRKRNKNSPERGNFFYPPLSKEKDINTPPLR